MSQNFSHKLQSQKKYQPSLKRLEKSKSKLNCLYIFQKMNEKPSFCPRAEIWGVCLLLKLGAKLKKNLGSSYFYLPILGFSYDRVLPQILQSHFSRDENFSYFLVIFE